MRLILIAVASAVVLAACSGDSSSISEECIAALDACACYPTANEGMLSCYPPRPPGVRPPIIYCPSGTGYGSACAPVALPAP